MYKNLSIHTQLGRAEEMMAGMAAHAERLAKRGIDAEFVARMKASHVEALEAQERKMAFKARMMESRAERNQHLEELHRLYAEVRKQVKIELPPETWREFGITDRW
jgi:hypothetical protein